jgi:hypothetical protein
MTITTTIVNVQEVAEGMSYCRPAFHQYVPFQTKVLDENGSNETIFKCMEGDPRYPTVVRRGVYNNKAKNGAVKGRQNISSKSSYWQTTTDTDTGETEYDQLDITLAISGPEGAAFASDNIRAAIWNAVGWLFDQYAQADGPPAATLPTLVLDRLAFGITELTDAQLAVLGDMGT